MPETARRDNALGSFVWVSLPAIAALLFEFGLKQRMLARTNQS
jgi:hypothetical protein